MGGGESPMDKSLEKLAEAVRYALGSNERTARLAMLIVLAILAWHVML
jgi:hypothetical protein